MNTRKRFVFICFALLSTASVLSLAATGVIDTPAPAPVRTDPVESMVKVIVALSFVVAAIFAAAWMFRRMGGLSGMATGSLRVVGGISLGGRERIVLVQVGEQQILLGVAPGRVVNLYVLPQPIEPGRSVVGVEGFAAKLQAALAQRKST